jgi:hypothetical protein
MQIVDDSGRLLLSLIGCFKQFVAQRCDTYDNLLTLLRAISISSSLIPLAATFGKLRPNIGIIMDLVQSKQWSDLTLHLSSLRNHGSCDETARKQLPLHSTSRRGAPQRNNVQKRSVTPGSDWLLRGAWKILWFDVR